MGRLTNNQGYIIHEKDLLRRYSECSFFFLDDLGTEKDSDHIRQQYFNIIDERVGNELPTVYTSNLDLGQIDKVLGERIASRLQITYQIEFPQQDLRRKVELPSI